MTTATPIEMKMIAYRKSAKDGFVVSFSIHPNDNHDRLAAAPIGARFMAALVEIGDDETPVITTSSVVTYSKDNPPPQSTPTKSREYSLPQRVAMVCNDGAFWKFLGEQYSYDCNNADDAAHFVRDQCNVKSRSEIQPGTNAFTNWTRIEGRYLGWQRGM